MGRPRAFRDERLQAVRSWRVNGFENWFVFYRPLDDGIRVLHVLHGARDLEQILGDDG